MKNDRVKKNYASMSDIQLVELYLENGLTQDAQLLLEKELVERGYKIGELNGDCYAQMLYDVMNTASDGSGIKGFIGSFLGRYHTCIVTSERIVLLEMADYEAVNFEVERRPDSVGALLPSRQSYANEIKLDNIQCIEFVEEDWFRVPRFYVQFEDEGKIRTRVVFLPRDKAMGTKEFKKALRLFHEANLNIKNIDSYD